MRHVSFIVMSVQHKGDAVSQKVSRVYIETTQHLSSMLNDDSNLKGTKLLFQESLRVAGCRDRHTFFAVKFYYRVCV